MSGEFICMNCGSDEVVCANCGKAEHYVRELRSDLAAERKRADDYAAEVFTLHVLLARARSERDALSVPPGTPRDA